MTALLFGLSLLISNSSFAQKPAAATADKKPLRITLDAGHGGRDSGAIRGKTRESAITLSVSQLLRKRLDRDPNFQVTMTRTKDRFVSLPRRAKISTATKTDLFVSLHVNSAPDPRARGVEFYFLNQLPADEDAAYLASLENQQSELEESLPEDLQHSNPEVSSILFDINRNYKISHSWVLAKKMQQTWTVNRSRQKSVRQAPFYLLGKVHSPAVLVEMGFLSNPKDIRKLSDKKRQAQIARDLHHALLEYKDLIDK